MRYSPLEQSLILMVAMGSSFFVAFFANFIFAKFNARNVVLFIIASRILSSLFFAIGIYSQNIILISIANIIFGFGFSLYMPAIYATLPSLVRHEKLLYYNSLVLNFYTLGRILGMAVAGIGLIVMPPIYLSFVAMGGYAVVFIILFQALPWQKKATLAINKISSGNYLKRLREYKITLLTIIPFTFIAGSNLFIINVSSMLESPQLKGMLYLIEGVALLVASLLIKNIRKILSLEQIIKLGCILILVAEFLQYVIISRLSVEIAFATFGFGVGLFIPVVINIIQKTIVPQRHGECLTTMQIVNNMLMFILLPVYGLLLDNVAYTSLMLFIFAFTAIIAILLFSGGFNTEDH